jgi:peptide deformylase
MTLEIVQAGHPVLRQQARPLTIDEVASRTIQDLIAAMRDTMRAAPGVGLAAPQVAEGLQLVVIEDPAGLPAEDLAAREREPVPFQVLVNPRLTVEDPTPVVHYEGCLSVNGFQAQVPRARAVRVDALDAHGRPVEIRASGWYARILQHEWDHLQGTLCIDRMDPRTFTTNANFVAFRPRQ